MNQKDTRREEKERMAMAQEIKRPEEGIIEDLMSHQGLEIDDSDLDFQDQPEDEEEQASGISGTKEQQNRTDANRQNPGNHTRTWNSQPSQTSGSRSETDQFDDTDLNFEDLPEEGDHGFGGSFNRQTEEPWKKAGRQNQEEKFIRRIVEASRSSAGQPCYGGKLVRSSNMNNQTRLFFVLENASETEVQYLDGAFDSANTIGGEYYLAYQKGYRSADGKYTVFQFALEDDQYSVLDYLQNSIHSAKQYFPCQNQWYVLPQLVCMRNEIYKRQKDDDLPILCISAETVFMNAKRKLRILPLISICGEYPVEIPENDLKNARGDIRTDLASIAMLELEVKNKSRDQDKLVISDLDNILHSMLCLVRGARPSLQEVLDTLTASGILEEKQSEEDASHPSDPFPRLSRLGKKRKFQSGTGQRNFLKDWMKRTDNETDSESNATGIREDRG